MSDRRLRMDSVGLTTWMLAVGCIGWGGCSRLLGLVVGLGLLGLSPAPASALLLAYIPNDTTPGTVSVIDTATNTVVGTILVGNDPYGIAVHPDLTRVYVTNSGSNRVSVIDTAINREIATIPVGKIPHGIAVHPAGTRVYVANGENGAGNTVSVIDTATNTEIATVQVGSFPNGVAVHPDGKVVYVTNIRSDSVSVIDTATNTVIATIPVEREPHDVTFHPAGTFAYVTNRQQSLSGCLRGSVSVIDTTARGVSATVCVGTFPHSPVVRPDGTRVYVTNRDDDTVSVISTATNTEITTIQVGDAPHGIDVHPDGTFAYVANAGSNSISVIDLATNTVATIPVGANPIAQGRFILPGFITPGISGLVPNTGGDIGNVSVFIYGQGFAKDATVKLTRPGQPDILGTSVQVQGFGDTIATTFDLAGKARGAWTVVVANPDGTSITLPDGFTIEEGRPAQVWVDVVGPQAVRANRPATFYVLYGNRGNIDTFDIVLLIKMPPGLAPYVKIQPPNITGINWAQVPQGALLGSEFIIPLWLYSVPVARLGGHYIHDSATCGG